MALFLDDGILDFSDAEEIPQVLGNDQVPEIEILDNELPEIDAPENEAEMNVKTVLKNYSKTLKGKSSIVEAVLLLMELDEPVASLERKLLRASESYISMMNNFSNMISIYNARKIFVDRKNELLSNLGDNSTTKQITIVNVSAKAEFQNIWTTE